jgi:hypothetical protein
MGVIAFAGIDFVAVLLGNDLDFSEFSIPLLVLRVLPHASGNPTQNTERYKMVFPYRSERLRQKEDIKWLASHGAAKLKAEFDKSLRELQRTLRQLAIKARKHRK